jgi:hypothetical protein
MVGAQAWATRDDSKGMMGSREGFRERRRRKKAARDRLAEKAEMVRADTRARAAERERAAELESLQAKERAREQAKAESEARSRSRSERKRQKAERKARRKAGVKTPKRPRESLLSRRRRQRKRRKGMPRGERVALHRAQLAELGSWGKSSLAEIGRRFGEGGREIAHRAQPLARPVGSGLAAVGSAIAAVLRPIGRAGAVVLAPVAPYISAVLFLVLRAVGTVVAGIATVVTAAVSWTVGLLVRVWRAVAGFAEREVTVPRTLAVVAGAAAVALIVSQFIDYRGIAVGGDQYSGEVQTVAPVPMVGVKTPVDTHSYVLIPLAVIALPLVWLTLHGRWKLGRAIALIGGIGLIVALGIDAPKGLDTGRLGDAYAGTEGRLLEGFWTEFFASLALVITGLALSKFVREEREGAPAASPSPDPEHAPTAPRSAWGSGAGA